MIGSVHNFMNGFQIKILQQKLPLQDLVWLYKAHDYMQVYSYSIGVKPNLILYDFSYNI